MTPEQIMELRTLIDDACHCSGPIEDVVDWITAHLSATPAAHESAKSVAVVPELTDADYPNGNNCPDGLFAHYVDYGFRRGWDALASRIQSIPADRVLREGQVAVDAEEREALRRAQAEWFALNLSLDPMNQMANSESGNFHRVRQLVEIAKRLGFNGARLVVGDEASDERVGEAGDDALDMVADNYGSGETFEVWYAIDGLGCETFVSLPSSDDPNAPRYALRSQAKQVGG